MWAECLCVGVCAAVSWSSFPLAFRRTRRSDREEICTKEEKKWKHLAGTEARSRRLLFVQLLAAASMDAQAAMSIISVSPVSGERAVSSRFGLATGSLMRLFWYMLLLGHKPARLTRAPFRCLVSS